MKYYDLFQLQVSNYEEENKEINKDKINVA